MYLAEWFGISHFYLYPGMCVNLNYIMIFCDCITYGSARWFDYMIPWTRGPTVFQPFVEQLGTFKVISLYNVLSNTFPSLLTCNNTFKKGFKTH